MQLNWVKLATAYNLFVNENINSDKSAKIANLSEDGCSQSESKLRRVAGCNLKDAGSRGLSIFSGFTSAVIDVRTGITVAAWESCRARPTTSTNTCARSVSRRRTP